MLKIENISFSYNSRIPVLNNLSFTFSENLIYGIYGANGSGKSTLFKILINKINSSSGSIDLNGFSPLIQRKIYKKMIIFSPDEPHYLPYLNGFEWLQFVLSAYDVKLNIEKFEELIDIFKFPEIHNRTGEYSYGMNKKLSMIVNLMVDPYCLLFDESFAGLDPFITNDVYNYVKSIKENKIILISSHQKDLTESLFDCLLFLKDGSLTLIDHFDDIFRITQDATE